MPDHHPAVTKAAEAITNRINAASAGCRTWDDSTGSIRDALQALFDAAVEQAIQRTLEHVRGDGL